MQPYFPVASTTSNEAQGAMQNDNNNHRRNNIGAQLSWGANPGHSHVPLTSGTFKYVPPLVTLNGGSVRAPGGVAPWRIAK